MKPLPTIINLPGLGVSRALVLAVRKRVSRAGGKHNLRSAFASLDFANECDARAYCQLRTTDLMNEFGWPSDYAERNFLAFTSGGDKFLLTEAGALFLEGRRSDIRKFARAKKAHRTRKANKWKGA